MYYTHERLYLLNTMVSSIMFFTSKLPLSITCTYTCKLSFIIYIIYLLTFSVIDLLKIKKNQYVDLYCIHDITLITTILIKIDVGFLKYTGACKPSISKVNYTVAYNGCRYRVRFINTLSCFEHNSRKGH